MSATPQLLVSVKNLSEAYIALQSGVDLIDIKNPEAGSLGKADNLTITQIALALQSANIPLSVALGELADWKPEHTENIPQNISYLKLGLSGMRDRSGWRSLWKSTQDQILAQNSELRAKWIAVAYVDADLAHAPAIQEIITFASESNCAGVLFDTYHKSSKHFFDWQSLSQLQHNLEVIHACNMLCAVAGQLNLNDVEQLATTNVDVIAVRSAACESGNRKAGICQEAIQCLIQALRSIAVSQ